jgi:hypothetical protein
MPPSIQKPQNSSAERGARPLDHELRVPIRHPRDDGLQRTEEVAGELATERTHVTGLEQREDAIERGDGRAAGRPFDLAPQEVLLRHHLQDGPDVLRHAAVHEHERVLECHARLVRHAVAPEQRVARQQASAADAVLGIARLRERALDQLHAGPESAGVLPAAARAAEPLAEDGAGRHHPALGFRHRSRQRADLPRGAHEGADERTEQGRRHREPRALRDPVDVADQFEAAARADDRAEQFRQAGARALDAWRHDAGRDDGGLEQPQVVASEVEDLLERAHQGRGLEIDAGEPDDRFVDDAQERLDGRAGRRRRARARRDRSRRSAPARPRDSPCRGRRCRSIRSASGPCARACARGASGTRPTPGRARAARAARAVADRQGGRAGTSTRCPAWSARCGAPGRRASGTRARGAPPRGRSRASRSGPRRPGPRETRRWLPRSVARAGGGSRRTARGRAAAGRHDRAGDSGGSPRGRRAPGRACTGSSRGGDTRRARRTPRAAPRRSVPGTTGRWPDRGSAWSADSMRSTTRSVSMMGEGSRCRFAAPRRTAPLLIRRARRGARRAA